jgi:hypothetical protein
MTTEELPQLLDDGIHDRFTVDIRQYLDCKFFMFHSGMVEHVPQDMALRRWIVGSRCFEELCPHRQGSTYMYT